MPPEIVRSPAELRRLSSTWRTDGKRIAYVPTMGYLHRGHESLLEEARRRGDVLVLSIFVNPTQFGPKEDLSRYPRDLEGDLDKAGRAGVDVAFVPEVDSMYTAGYQTFVDVRELSKGLCGASRPGHFTGVALFGEKDFQQLQVIKRMVRDLNLDVDVVGMPIVREPDGLALSSRNAYLSPDERNRALALHRALKAAAEAYELGEREAARLVDTARVELHLTPGVRLDYLELRDAETLELVEGRVSRPSLLAVAAFVGSTRLIDNRVLGS